MKHTQCIKNCYTDGVLHDRASDEYVRCFLFEKKEVNKVVIKVYFPAGADNITVDGLTQWAYGQTLKIYGLKLSRPWLKYILLIVK